MSKFKSSFGGKVDFTRNVRSK